jgi:osmoprotectant transport system substrate-binding protein
VAIRYGKGLIGGVVVVALLALLVHWIGINTIELYRAERFMQIFNIGNTVPPLAVLAIALGVLGIGSGPAIFALFLASLLPIVRNTYEGLKNVQGSLKEAATGIGMTPRQVLFRVELPNAVPIIIGGVRVALAINVGTAPLAFLIGANSLGSLIFPGIALNNQPQLLLGAACTALLALLLDGLVTMNRLTLILSCVLLFAGIAQAAEKPVIRIGARVFTEQTLLAEITSQYLRTKGYDARVTGGLGSNLARSAQESGQLDLIWEYTGVSLVAYNHVDEKLDSEQSYARVKELDAKKGLVWLSPSKFSNTYALALPENVAKEFPQINTISDLTQALAEKTKGTRLVALDTEFANRSDGMGGMVKLYDMNLTRKNTRQMDAGLVYTALRNGQVFAGLVYTTDGRLNAFKLKLLEDDKHYFPDYTAAPVIRQQYLDQHPQLAAELKPLAELFNDATMRELNARVDVEHESPSAVAADFLRQHPIN